MRCSAICILNQLALAQIAQVRHRCILQSKRSVSFFPCHSLGQVQLLEKRLLCKTSGCADEVNSRVTTIIRAALVIVKSQMHGVENPLVTVQKHKRRNRL